MLQRVVRRVSEVAGKLVVVAAPGQDLPPLPASVLVTRDPVRGRGPLQGLAAGLAALPEEVELAFGTATDVPFLEPAWISRLLALLGDHDLALPYSDGYYHPLAALYRRAAALPAIERLLQSGRLRPLFLTEVLRTRIVMPGELCEVDPKLATLRNLNTMDDYRSALSEAGYAGGESLAPLSVMPRVTVELFGVPRLRAGLDQLTVCSGTLGEALRALGRTCPALVGTVLTAAGSLQSAYTVNLNGETFITDPSTCLSEGDRLILLAVDAGG
jgi:molybdopterin-guanine dinucleotide biosynthesis protein A